MRIGEVKKDVKQISERYGRYVSVGEDQEPVCGEGKRQGVILRGLYDSGEDKAVRDRGGRERLYAAGSNGVGARRDKGRRESEHRKRRSVGDVRGNRQICC